MEPSIFCLTYKYGTTSMRVVVPATNVKEAEQNANTILQEDGHVDWKFTGTIEPIRAFIAPGADATLIKPVTTQRAATV